MSHALIHAIQVLGDAIEQDEKFGSVSKLVTKHDLKEMEVRIMSKLTDWAAQEQADLDTISSTLDGVVIGIAALNKQIADFNNSPGTLSPDDQAALDKIQAASGALVTKSAAIAVTAPSPVPVA